MRLSCMYSLNAILVFLWLRFPTLCVNERLLSWCVPPWLKVWLHCINDTHSVGWVGNTRDMSALRLPIVSLVGALSDKNCSQVFLSGGRTEWCECTLRTRAPARSCSSCPDLIRTSKPRKKSYRLLRAERWPLEMCALTKMIRTPPPNRGELQIEN